MARARQILRGAEKYAEVVRELERIGKTYITVGVQGNQADEVSDSGSTLAEIATYNEFGTSTIPERPFIRSTFDERREELATVQERVLERVADGRMSSEQANGIVGQWAASAVQAQIARGVPPPNSPVTIAKKGSSHPLIDHGRLRQSISYEVHAGRPEDHS